MKRKRPSISDSKLFETGASVRGAHGPLNEKDKNCELKKGATLF